MTSRSDHEFPSGSGPCAAWVYGPEDAGRARALLETALAGSRELSLTGLVPRIDALLA